MFIGSYGDALVEILCLIVLQIVLLSSGLNVHLPASLGRL